MAAHARENDLMKLNPQLAQFILEVPQPAPVDAAGERAADAYQTIVHGLAGGQPDTSINNAIMELQIQAGVHGNHQAEQILQALNKLGLTPSVLRREAA